MKPHRFQPGQSGNPGGKPFIKIHQKLSVIAAEEMSVVADVEVSKALGLPEGATWGRCVVKAMIIKASVERDVGAAHFLNQCTESARAQQGSPTELTYKIEYENSTNPALEQEFIDVNRQVDGDRKN